MLTSTTEADSVLDACESDAFLWLNPSRCWVGSLAAYSKWVGRPKRRCVSFKLRDGALVLFRETTAHPSFWNGKVCKACNGDAARMLSACEYNAIRLFWIP
jgi:hypothetical protein